MKDANDFDSSRSFVIEDHVVADSKTVKARREFRPEPAHPRELRESRRGAMDARQQMIGGIRVISGDAKPDFQKIAAGLRTLIRLRHFSRAFRPGDAGPRA